MVGRLSNMPMFENSQLLGQPGQLFIFLGSHPFDEPEKFHTTRLLRKNPLHHHNLYAICLLHQIFTPEMFYTQQFFHWKRRAFYTRSSLQHHFVTVKSSYTKLKPFTPKTFYTRNLLHQKVLQSCDAKQSGGARSHMPTDQFSREGVKMIPYMHARLKIDSSLQKTTESSAVRPPVLHVFLFSWFPFCFSPGFCVFGGPSSR